MRPRRRAAAGIPTGNRSVHVLSLREQAKRIHAAWPSLDVQGGTDALVVRGDIQPTPLTDTYAVRIEYKIGRLPKAYVESPKLTPRDGAQSIPHVYRDPDLRPCLFYPDGTQWASHRSLARTVIPWLALWLYYYELWHATGEWCGGGAAHGSTNSLTDPKPATTEPPAADPGNS